MSETWARGKFKDYVKSSERPIAILENTLMEKRISYEEYGKERDRISLDLLLRFREIGKKWWRDNKEAFLAGRYNEVRPGGMMPVAADAPDKGSSNDRILQRPTSPESQSRDSTSTPNPTAPEPTRKPSGNYLIFAAVAAFLAAIIIFFRNRLARKKPRAS